MDRRGGGLYKRFVGGKGAVNKGSGRGGGRDSRLKSKKKDHEKMQMKGKTHALPSAGI